MRDHEADEAAKLPISDLLEPWILLRPVRRDLVEYLELKDAIDREGLLSSISVRHSPQTPGKYEIITGNYRHAACVELGWTTIPCIIKHGVTDERVFALQVQENAIRPTTKPVEFSRQLKKIFDRRPEMTVAELSILVGKRAEWVKERLSLLDLSKPLQLMVDRGEIPVSSAYMLAKINPPRVREEYAEQARILPTKQFCAIAAGVIKRFAECVHQGKLDERYLPKYEPQAYLRGLKEIKAELEHPAVGALILVTDGCKTMMDAWKAALSWVVHMDRQSVKEQTTVANIRARLRIEREATDESLE